MTYINWRGPQGRETIDQLDEAGFPTRREAYAELRRLVSEYALCGIQAYTSQRCCANWKGSAA